MSTQQCQQCKTQISPAKRAGTKYCSTRCRVAAHRQKQITYHSKPTTKTPPDSNSERHCAQCKRIIESHKRKDTLYCSTRCRVAAHRKPHIPPQMLTQQRWVNHDTKKRPLNPHTGHFASCNDPDTWASYEEAKNTRKPLGYMLGNGIGCIDLDHCIHPDGSLTPAAKLLVDAYKDNWIEYSPSGEGLHIWGTAEEQPGFKRIWNNQQIEFYSRQRYITITGKTYQKGNLNPL